MASNLADPSMPSPSPTPLLLWSAGNRLKFKINQRFFRYHYVWCSPTFDAGAVARYQVGAGQPGSSDPVSIYRRLHDDVRRSDRHSDAIQKQRESLQAVALQLRSDGKISAQDAADVAYILETAEILDWIPLIYAIPYAPVAARVQLVPIEKRASIEPEYIIPDLVEGEFETIEPWPCP